MNAIDLIVKQLAGNLEFFKMTLSDFTDAEMLVRPVPSANHPLWQLGHLCAGEVFMLNKVKSGVMPELPAGFGERFDPKNQKGQDLAQFAPKQQLLELLTTIRQATIAFAKTLSPQDLDQPSPEEFRHFAPTLADVLVLQVGHVMMHLGQMQVARRKLGKAVLF